MKAMILAAGLGKRLHPLTLTTPKPLLKIGHTTLIDHALHQLQLADITEVVINVHYLRDQIMRHCGDGRAYQLKITYSVEETLLETGGGIFHALPLLGDSPFLVISADVWTDYPLKQLTQQKTQGAHLIFVDNPIYHASGDYALTAQGIVQHADHGHEKLTYANIAVLHPLLFHAEKPGVFKLNRIFQSAISKGIVTGERYAGVWHNVGTAEDLDCLSKNTR